MTDQQYIFEQIEDYLHDRMSPEDKLAFEQRLLKEESLAAQVDEARATDEAIHFANLADLKKTIGQDIKKISYQPRWKNASYWIGSLILAGALSALLFFTKEDKPTNGAPAANKNVAADQPVENQTQPTEKTEIPSSEKKKSSAPAQPSQKSEADNTEGNTSVNAADPATTDTPSAQNETGTTSPIAGEDSKKLNEPAQPEPKNNCSEVFNIHTEPSCKHKETGSITVSTDGGKEFTFQVDHQTMRGTRGVFHHLSPGAHKVLVSYHKECTFTKTVHIEEKWCPLNQSFSFNPDYQEKWEIRYEEGSQGKWVIYDRAGREIYKSTFGSGNESWNGTDMNGASVPVGSYMAVLYYSDGRKEKVDLTIVR